MSERPESRLTRVDRLEAAAEPLRDEGGVSRDTGASSAGTFTGRELNGKRLPGVSADWQTVLVDGTAIGDIRYTLRTDYGALAEATTERASRQR